MKTKMFFYFGQNSIRLDFLQCKYIMKYLKLGLIKVYQKEISPFSLFWGLNYQWRNPVFGSKLSPPLIFNLS